MSSVTAQKLGRILILLMKGFPIGLAAPERAELIPFAFLQRQWLKTAEQGLMILLQISDEALLSA